MLLPTAAVAHVGLKTQSLRGLPSTTEASPKTAVPTTVVMNLLSCFPSFLAGTIVVSVNALKKDGAETRFSLLPVGPGGARPPLGEAFSLGLTPLRGG